MPPAKTDARSRSIFSTAKISADVLCRARTRALADIANSCITPAANVTRSPTAMTNSTKAKPASALDDLFVRSAGSRHRRHRAVLNRPSMTSDVAKSEPRLTSLRIACFWRSDAPGACRRSRVTQSAAARNVAGISTDPGPGQAYQLSVKPEIPLEERISNVGRDHGTDRKKGPQRERILHVAAIKGDHRAADDRPGQ